MILYFKVLETDMGFHGIVTEITHFIRAIDRPVVNLSSTKLAFLAFGTVSNVTLGIFCPKTIVVSRCRESDEYGFRPRLAR